MSNEKLWEVKVADESGYWKDQPPPPGGGTPPCAMAGCPPHGVHWKEGSLTPLNDDVIVGQAY